MFQHVLEVRWDQSIVHRHDHRADRGGRIEGLEELVRVGRDHGNAVAFTDPGAAQRVRLLIDPRVELRPGQAQIAVDDCLSRSVELGGAAQEIVD